MARRKIHPLTLRILIEIGVLVTVLVLLLVWIGNVWSSIGEAPEDTGQAEPDQTQTEASPPEETVPQDTSPEGIMESFLTENGLSRADYPEFVLECYEKSAQLYGEYFEAQDFLLNYPLKYGVKQTVDISDVDPSEGVPLFMQWDDRWGYLDYGVSICGIGGCGPTSLSMVAYYWTGNPKYTPVYMMEFAQTEGHTGSTGGTNWSLFSKGAVALGFQVEELPAVEKTVARRLEAGIPVVVNVGPGTFTTGGHYMVLVGYEDGKFRINDPNSVEYSSRLWAWDEFVDQVRNFWAISLP